MSEAAGRVADSTGNWVDNRAPAWTRPYLRLARLDRPIGSWLLLLPCWWSLGLAAVHAGKPVNAWHAVLFFVGAFAMRGAGCTWNDIVDRDLDRLVRLRALCRRDLLGHRLRHRLRPSGPRGRRPHRYQIDRAFVPRADQADARHLLFACRRADRDGGMGRRCRPDVRARPLCLRR